MIFLDTKFVENVVIKLVPVLFENYEDGMGDFAYLGGDAGRGKLESSLAQPRQTFYGEYLYPTISDKTAAMVWSIIKNHPFVDGNKRAALTAANLFLLMNDRLLLATQDDSVSFCRRIADGAYAINQEEVSSWLEARIVSYSDPDFHERTEAFMRENVEEERDDLVAAMRFFEQSQQHIIDSGILNGTSQ